LNIFLILVPQNKILEEFHRSSIIQREPMKNTLRKRWLSMIALLSLALPCAALEQHEFHSNDNSQSFHGQLTDYDAAKKVVTVKLKNGKVSKFKLSLLSEDDQKYVIHNQVTLSAVKGLQVSFKEVKGKITRTKEGLIRTTVTPTSYDVTVYNRTKTPMRDLTLNYHYYYCVGTLTPGGAKHTPKVTTGRLMFDKLFGQDTATLTTSTINITRARKKAVLPTPGGGGGGG
jgi:hypothetical protein